MASATDLRTKLIAALNIALGGDWDAAHKIVQAHEDDAIACRIHAVLHKIEGDASNSRYWYARSGGHAYDDFTDPKVELAAIKTSLA